MQLTEINGFLLKSALQIPTASWVNVARIVLLVPALYATTVELYAFSREKTKKIGSTAWLVLSILFLEILLCFKNFTHRNSLG